MKDADSASLALLDIPQNISPIEYTSSRLSVSDGSNPPSWYTSLFDDTNSIDTVYKDDGGNVLSTLPVNVGKYTVEFSIKPAKTSDINWKDYNTNSSLMRSIQFEITPKPITATVTGGGNVLPSVTHNASELGQNDSGLTKIFDFHYQNRPGTAAFS